MVLPARMSPAPVFVGAGAYRSGRSARPRCCRRPLSFSRRRAWVWPALLRSGGSMPSLAGEKVSNVAFRNQRELRDHPVRHHRSALVLAIGVHEDAERRGHLILRPALCIALLSNAGTELVPKDCGACLHSKSLERGEATRSGCVVRALTDRTNCPIWSSDDRLGLYRGNCCGAWRKR